jgi:hypothetical protein
MLPIVRRGGGRFRRRQAGCLEGGLCLGAMVLDFGSNSSRCRRAWKPDASLRGNLVMEARPSHR